MSSVAATLDGFPSVLSRTWVWVRRLFWGAVVVMAVVLVLQLAQLYRLLHDIHPLVAVAAALVAGGALVGWVGWIVVRYLRMPRVLSPPHLPAPEEGWTSAQREAYRRFALCFLRRQARNPHLEDAFKARIPGAIERIEALRASADPAELAKQVESELQQILAPLDAVARRLIRRAAVEVAMSTAVSPSVMLDSLITLNRNVNLMAKLADLYYGRPGLPATLRILRDVLGSAVTAGALEMVSDRVSSALTEMTGSWASRLIGPLGQGMINGVITMRLGAAAQQRCRSLTGRRVTWLPWKLSNYRKAASALAAWVGEDVGPWVFGPLGKLARWTGKTTRSTVRGGAGILSSVRDRLRPGLSRREDVGEEDEPGPASLPGDPVLDGLLN
jgi:putative membrane protein